MKQRGSGATRKMAEMLKFPRKGKGKKGKRDGRKREKKGKKEGEKGFEIEWSAV